MSVFAPLSALRPRHGILAVALLPLLLLHGCTGMYMGAYGDTSNNTSSGALSEDIAAKAEIHTINPQTVRQLRIEREAREQIAKARRQANAIPSMPYQYKVAPQDSLSVTVWDHPELNNPGQVTNEPSARIVNDDGSFYYPYVGQVQAAGRTVKEIRDDLAARLSNVLSEPQVDVRVLQYRGRRAFAVGQLTKPGPMPITDVPLRITDVITQAEGFTPLADLSNVILTRQNVAQKIDLYALYYQGDLTQNVLLQDGDILNIPDQHYNKAFVLGEVNAPQSLPLPRGNYTLAEVLADAGGVNQITGNASQVYVLRAADSGRPQIWHLNASSPDALILADSFHIQARDVVYVDPAAVTRWSRIINQILPTSQFVLQGADVSTSIRNR